MLFAACFSKVLIVDELETIGGEIDQIDEQLVQLLAKRFACSKRVVEIKNEIGKPVFDAQREAELLEIIIKKAEGLGLSATVSKAIFNEILHQSRRAQEARVKDK
mgnify:CR=1 FL=1